MRLIFGILSVLVVGRVFAQPSEKRGLGYGYHSENDLNALSEGVSWWYNWHYLPDEKVRDSYQEYGVDYVPMAWNGGFDREGLEAYLEANPRIEYLLGFNEPNFLDQANMTPTEAAQVWPELEAVAEKFDLQLVGPAVNFCGSCVSENGITYTDPIEYLDDFFEACTDCRVDYIAVHWYGCGGVDWYLDLFKKYGLPIWVTEIACWDGDNISLDQQKSFLINAVDLMENDPDVFRYAWFIGRGEGPHIALLDGDGELTELGEIYVNMPVHDTTQYTLVPARIEAENYQYMTGIQLELTQDSDGLMNVGYIDAGDRIGYQIEVLEGGSYFMNFRFAATGSGKLGLILDGAPVKTIDLANTGGWQNWQTFRSHIDLQPGRHLLELDVVRGGFNLNWVDILTEDNREVLSDHIMSSLKVYPNPADDYLVVVPAFYTENNTLTLRSLSGQIVFHREDLSKTQLAHVVVNFLPAGLYIVEYTSTSLGGQPYSNRVLIR